MKSNKESIEMSNRMRNRKLSQSAARVAARRVYQLMLLLDDEDVLRQIFSEAHRTISRDETNAQELPLPSTTGRTLN